MAPLRADKPGLPKEVRQAEHSDQLKRVAVLRYLLGISYRGVEDFLAALGYPLDHVTVYRDFQGVEEKARGMGEAGERGEVGRR